MELTLLTAISPIDGRYRKTTESLANYFSEYALFKYRVLVEVRYFIALCELDLPQLGKLTDSQKKGLHGLYQNFTLADALKIKELLTCFLHMDLTYH